MLNFYALIETKSLEHFVTPNFYEKEPTTFFSRVSFLPVSPCGTLEKLHIEHLTVRGHRQPTSIA